MQSFETKFGYPECLKSACSHTIQLQRGLRSVLELSMVVYLKCDCFDSLQSMWQSTPQRCLRHWSLPLMLPCKATRAVVLSWSQVGICQFVILILHKQVLCAGVMGHEWVLKWRHALCSHLPIASRFSHKHIAWGTKWGIAWGMLLSKITDVACPVAVCLQSFTATTPRRKGLL